MLEFNMKKAFKLAAVCLMVAIAAISAIVILSFVVKKGKDFVVKNGDGPQLPSCGNNQVLFTHSPVDIEYITSITPLGNLNPPGHTFPVKHMYINLKNIDSPTDAEEETPIRTLYAPGDIWIQQISSTEYLDRGEYDYSIDFSPCAEFSAYFIHVTSLSEKLEEAFSNGEGDCWEEDPAGQRMRSCNRRVHIKLEAGEEIGTVGGDKFNFDLGASDMRVEPSKAARYDRRFEGIGYVICPLDYFSSDIKEALYAKLGDSSSGGQKRTIEPICGTPHQEFSGTAQGVWYLEDSTQLDREDQHIALVHDNIDPKIPVFSIGTSLEKFGIESRTYEFEPESTGLVDRDFADVKADGNIYCYEFNESSGDGVFQVLLQMVTDEELKIGKGRSTWCGSAPWGFEDYVMFEKLD